MLRLAFVSLLAVGGLILSSTLLSGVSVVLSPVLPLAAFLGLLAEIGFGLVLLGTLLYGLYLLLKELKTLLSNLSNLRHSAEDRITLMESASWSVGILLLPLLWAGVQAVLLAGTDGGTWFIVFWLATGLTCLTIGRWLQVKHSR